MEALVDGQSVHIGNVGLHRQREWTLHGAAEKLT